MLDRLSAYILLSLVAHGSLIYGGAGSFDFGAVIPAGTVTVELTSLSPEAPAVLPTPPAAVTEPPPEAKQADVPVVETAVVAQKPVPEKVPDPPPLSVVAAPAAPPPTQHVDTASPEPSESIIARTLPVVTSPLRRSTEFISVERETLHYQVKMHGVPVGSAQLEADTSTGDFRISLKILSAPALSAVYPVQNQIETRHIGGNFIITKIRQQEGSFRSDRGFTISLRERSVFWVDLLNRKHLTEEIPTSEVLDPFSALYYLRNRPLEPGRTEIIHVYDGDGYAELPVEVLRREPVRLSSSVTTDTLVLRPLLKGEAVLRRTGDMFIWVTDDAFKVPVKVETSIMLGNVTAELISSEIVPAGSTHLTPAAPSAGVSRQSSPTVNLSRD